MFAKSTKVLVAALVLAAASFTFVASASAVPGQSGFSQGHQGEAPPWSFACMKDHGPSDCGEPMWIYGN